MLHAAHPRRSARRDPQRAGARRAAAPAVATTGSRRWPAGSTPGPTSPRAARRSSSSAASPLSHGVAAALAGYSAGRLLRHRDDRPLDRRRHGHLPGRASPGSSAPRITVRQYLLPDYPYEPPLLRAVAADLATAPRIVTYNGRSFDLPMLAARLTVHGLFREQAALPAAHDDLLPDARRLFRRPARRRPAGRRRGRRPRRAAQLGLPGQRGAGALLRLPARRLAGHPGRGARPQLPGRRQPRPARGRAASPARRRLARGDPSSTRAAWRWSCCAPAQSTTRSSWSSRPRPWSPTRRRPTRCVASRRACSSRSATSSGPRSCGRSARGGPRSTRRGHGSRSRASGSGIAATCAAQWRRPRRRRASSTSRSRSAAADRWPRWDGRGSPSSAGFGRLRRWVAAAERRGSRIARRRVA